MNFENTKLEWLMAGREITPAARYTALRCAFPLQSGMGSGNVIDEDDGSYLFVFQIPGDVKRAVRIDDDREFINILRDIDDWAKMYEGTPEARKVQLRFELYEHTYSLLDLKKRQREVQERVSKTEALVESMEYELSQLGGLEVAK